MNIVSFKKNRDIHVLVIGFGSIGARHTRLFEEIGARVTILSRRNPETICSTAEVVSDVLQLSDRGINYIIIANESAAHADTLIHLTKLEWVQNIPILVEKPLINRLCELSKLERALVPIHSNISIGFNLRFLPVVIAARRKFDPNTPLVRASFHSHSYLPHWRTGQDYRETSSATRLLGGGVIRDLSHELDLAIWFCDTLTQSRVVGGTLSNLEIDVEDNIEVVGTSPKCQLVNISLSYSQHVETRSLSLVSNEQTVIADLMTGTLIVANAHGCRTFSHPCLDFDDTYRAMHDAVLNRNDLDPASLADGVANVKLIDQLEADTGWFDAT